MQTALVAAATLVSGFTPAPQPPKPSSGLDRRAVVTGGFLGAVSTVVSPLAAAAKIESVNPANNYYFPMAKYRYLPRILRAWIAIDQLAPQAMKDADWEGLQEVWVRIAATHRFNLCGPSD